MMLDLPVWKTVPIEIAVQHVNYNPETGAFTRLRSCRGIPAGAAAGWTTAQGYRSITIGKVAVYAHRLAWAIVHRQWPDVSIDHINGNRQDNRISNLRVATHAQNLANRFVRKDSESGIKGVRQNKRTGKWQARIELGNFGSAEDAARAHALITEMAWGEFGRSGPDAALAAMGINLGAVDGSEEEGA
jgi:hypothetical protein